MRTFRFSARFRLVFAMAILFTLVFSTQIAPVFAAAITVNSLLDGAPAVDGLCTLREAIQNANDNAATNADCAAGAGADVIGFSVSGTINLNAGQGQYIILDTTGSLTINGSGITILGTNTVGGPRIFHVGNATTNDQAARTLILNSIAIQRGGGTGTSLGQPSQFGGCILVAPNSTVTINGSTIGGATVALGCRATNGGGIYGDENATVTLDSGTILRRGQATTNGGGVYIITGTLNVIGASCIINSSGTFGGGVFLGDNAFLNLGDGTTTGYLISNTAAHGGGVYVDTNGGFTGNLGRIFNNVTSLGSTGSGYEAAGGAFSRSCVNCCIVNNTSDAGSGIYSVYQPAQGLDSSFNGNWWGSSWGPRGIDLPGTSSDASWGDSISGPGTSGNGIDITLTDANPAPGGQSMPQVASYLTSGPSDCSNDICTSPSSVDPSARSCVATKS